MQDNRYESYFTDLSIVKALAKHRLKKARSNHDRLFLAGLSGIDRPTKDDAGYFPPRRQWARFRPKKDQRRDNTTTNVTQRALIKCMMNGLRKGAQRKPWAAELGTFIRRIRGFALTGAGSLNLNPSIKPEPKDSKPKDGKLEYRVLAIHDLDARVYFCQVARYLRSIFDPLFDCQSYAFRIRSAGTEAPSGLEHHRAAKALLDYRVANPGTLFVAEIDLQKFFDTVPHEAARSAFRAISQQAMDRGCAIDPRARRAFDAFVECYDFINIGLPRAREALHQTPKRDNVERCVPWAEGELRKKYGESIQSIKVGIPQGGAISCLIANIMLDAADKRIRAKGAPCGSEASPSYFYARYCDDMILASPSRALCETLFREYKQAILDIGLIPHDARVMSDEFGYGKRWWNSAKSRDVYPWAAIPQQGHAAPWVGFVGYQIRYDGLLRVRPSSLRSENRKQEKLLGLAIRALAARARMVSDNVPVKTRSAWAMEYRLRQRLNARAIGKDLLSKGDVKAEPCWASGFALLRTHDHPEGQLRELDRSRDRRLRRFRAWIARLNKDGALKLGKRSADERSVIRGSKSRHRPRFIGRPWSYVRNCAVDLARGSAWIPRQRDRVPKTSGATTKIE